MSRTLTPKQKKFVGAYIKTGNATISALKSYDTTDYKTANNIGSENLAKPSIQKELKDMLPDDLLRDRHLELLNKREIIKGYKGFERIDEPDTLAVSKGLDMAYKIKGFYAPEKNINVNIDFSPNEEEKKRANEALKALLS